MDPQSLARRFSLNYQVLCRNTEGLTHQDWLLQPAPAGNCLNWVLGHILASRNGILRLAGAEPVWGEDREALYKRGSPPLTDAAKAVPWETMLADLETSQKRLETALPLLTPEMQQRQAGDVTAAEMLDLLQFHEAYHAGQVGLLRRLAGKEGQIR